MYRLANEKTKRLVDGDDVAAKEYAEQLVDGHDVELWQGDRKVTGP
jgi:hypothetical protein